MLTVRYRFASIALFPILLLGTLASAAEKPKRKLPPPGPFRPYSGTRPPLGSPQWKFDDWKTGNIPRKLKKTTKRAASIIEAPVKGH